MRQVELFFRKSKHININMFNLFRLCRNDEILLNTRRGFRLVNDIALKMRYLYDATGLF